MLKIMVVSESKAGKQGGKNGPNFHKNKCLQNSTKSKVTVKSTTEIMKIILNAENSSGLGLKITMKKDKQGAKFTWKVMCSEFHQINRKGKVTNRDNEN